MIKSTQPNFKMKKVVTVWLFLFQFLTPDDFRDKQRLRDNFYTDNFCVEKNI